MTDIQKFKTRKKASDKKLGKRERTVIKESYKRTRR